MDSNLKDFHERRKSKKKSLNHKQGEGFFRVCAFLLYVAKKTTKNKRKNEKKNKFYDQF